MTSIVFIIRGKTRYAFIQVRQHMANDDRVCNCRVTITKLPACSQAKKSCLLSIESFLDYQKCRQITIGNSVKL